MPLDIVWFRDSLCYQDSFSHSFSPSSPLTPFSDTRASPPNGKMSVETLPIFLFSTFKFMQGRAPPSLWLNLTGSELATRVRKKAVLWLASCVYSQKPWYVHLLKYLLNTCCARWWWGYPTVNTIGTVLAITKALSRREYRQVGKHWYSVYELWLLCGVPRRAELGHLIEGFRKASRTKWFWSPASKMMGLTN